MKKILFTLALLALVPLVSNADVGEKKTAIYFSASWCSHCQKVNAYFTQQGFYGKYDIQKMNFDEAQNKELLGKIFTAEGKSENETGIPAILIDDKLLIGDQPIIDGFKNTIDTSNGTTQMVLDQIKNGTYEKQSVVSDVNDVKTPNKKFGADMPIVVLLFAAIADAVNPCALAVLILLLATVVAAKGKNSALLSGLMFSLAVFLSYLLMGIGTYSAIAAVSISKYLSIGAGILAILVAAANFKDVFWYGKGFIMEVPLSWRPAMQGIIKKATGPWSAFGIGFLVSLFLVPCASGPYIAILARLAERVDVAKSYALLVLYNLVFISPMVIITLGMYFFDARMGKLEGWRQNNLKVLHAITGTVMLIVGLYLIYTRM